MVAQSGSTEIVAPRSQHAVLINVIVTNQSCNVWYGMYGIQGVNGMCDMNGMYGMYGMYGKMALILHTVHFTKIAQCDIYLYSV